MYNIPQGTLVILLPGLCLLIMGAIMFALERETSWREGIVSTGFVMLILGAGLTLAGSTMCLWPILCNHTGSNPPQTSVDLTYRAKPCVSNVGRAHLYGYDTPTMQTSDTFTTNVIVQQNPSTSDVTLLGVNQLKSTITQPPFISKYSKDQTFHNAPYNPKTGQYVMNTSHSS